MTVAAKMETASSSLRKPKLGFLGTGWIGQLRMEALAQNDQGNISIICDANEQAAKDARDKCAQNAIITSDFQDLLRSDVDGVVIATPSAMHKEQCLAALAAGKAVFCQKPLARTGQDTSEVIEAARKADRLLGIDFSYRYLAGIEKMRELLGSGDLGEIFSAELVFHNAYGPDKPWFYNYEQSGGGCAIDLGIHLIDLALWLLGTSPAEEVTSRLYRNGQRLTAPITEVEDYASIHFQVNNTDVQLGCSWNLHAGQDALIGARFYGTKGSVELSNVGGSFFDFQTFLLQGTQRQQLAGYPEDWGGRALCDWAEQLNKNAGFNPEVEQALTVARVLDKVYQR